MNTVSVVLIVIVFLALALACGFVTKTIAERQGRNGKTWFVVGALSAVVGIALALYLRRRKAHGRQS